MRHYLLYVALAAILSGASAFGAVIKFPFGDWDGLHVETNWAQTVILDFAGRRVMSFQPSPKDASLDGMTIALRQDHLIVDVGSPAKNGLRALVVRCYPCDAEAALSGRICAHMAEWQGAKGASIDVYIEGRDALSGKHFSSKSTFAMTGRRRNLSHRVVLPEKLDNVVFRYDITKFSDGRFYYFGTHAAPEEELKPRRELLPKRNPALIFYAPFDGSALAMSSRGDPMPIVERGLSYDDGVKGRAVRLVERNASELAYRAAENFDLRQGTISLWVKDDSNGGKNSRSRTVVSFPESGDMSGNGHIWFYWAGRRLRFDAGDDARHVLWSEQEIDESWRHLAVAWDDERIRIWVDGICVADSRGSASGDSGSPMKAVLQNGAFDYFTYDRTPADVFSVGGKGAGKGCFEGLIDEFRVWDAPLSDDELMAVYGAERPVSREKADTDDVSMFLSNKPNEHVGGVGLDLELAAEYRFDAESMARYMDEKRFKVAGTIVEKSLKGVPYLEAGTNRNDRFAFMFDIDSNVPLYCFDFDYPDDAKRTCDLIVQFKEARTGDYALQVGYFTGDEYPNTGNMLTHRCLYWATAEQNSLAVVAMTARENAPAALAALRIYKVKDARLPPLVLHEPKPNGGWNRMFGMYWEDPAIGYDFATGGHGIKEVSGLIDRTVAYMKYCGQNLFCYPGVWYQGRIGANGYNPRMHAHDFLSAWYAKFDNEGLFFVPNVNPNNMQVPAGLVTLEKMNNGGLHDTPIAIHDTGKPNWGGWHNTPPNFNFFHPDVQAQIERHIDDLLDQGVSHPSFKGVCMHLTMHCMCWFGDIRSGYNDYAVRAFSKDSGLNVPIDESDPMRGRASARWIRENALDAWVQWRCDQVTRFYARIAAKLRARRPDLKLWLNSFVQPDWNWPDFMEDGFMTRQAREGGLDRVALGAIPNLILCQTQLPAFYRKRERFRFPNDATYLFNRELQTKPSFFSLLKGADFPWINQHDLYWENPVGSNKSALNGDGFTETSWRVTTLNPSGYHALRDFVLPLRFGDVLGMSKGGFLVGTYGMEEHLRRFAAAFRALPAVVMEEVGRSGDVLLRQTDYDGKSYFYLVNTGCEHAKVSLVLPKGTTNLVTGEKMDTLVLDEKLGPYQLDSFVAPSGRPNLK